MKNTSKIYVTQAGYDQYMSALEEYRRQRTEHLKTRGDYGVNTYENHQTAFFDEELDRIEATISDLKDTISRLEIVKKEHSTDGRIGLGDIVVAHYVGTDKMIRVQLSGKPASIEEMMQLTRVTLQSPMGAALNGRKVGEIVTYKVGQQGRREDMQTITLAIISKEDALEMESTEEKQQGKK